MAASTGSPTATSTSATSRPTRGIGAVEHEVSPGASEPEPIQCVDLLAEVADAGDIHARQQHDVGRDLDRCQRSFVEPGRGVDDDIWEVASQDSQYPGCHIVGDGFTLLRSPRAGEHVEPRLFVT